MFASALWSLGLLFLKYCILGYLAQNEGFRHLATYYFDILVNKWYQKVLMICRNMLINGLQYFWGVSGPLFMKYYIWAVFGEFKGNFQYDTNLTLKSQSDKTTFLHVIPNYVLNTLQTNSLKKRFSFRRY